MVMAIFWRPFFAFTAAFTLFGLLAVISRSAEAIVNQERWPKAINLFVNVLLVATSIYASVQLQMHVFP
jgi:hypothetical protein